MNMNGSSKYHQAPRTFQPPIHRGRIVELCIEKNYGKIETTNGEEVTFTSKTTNLNSFKVGEIVAFEKHPSTLFNHKYNAGNVLKTYRSKDGYLVTDRKYSHVHGDLSKRLQFILGRIDCKGSYHIHHIEHFPFSIGKSNCVIVTWEDEVVYAKRVGRTHFSKFVKNRQEESTNYVTIILKMEQGIYVISSAFYGNKPEADIDYENDKNHNTDYWGDHAIIYGTEPIYPETETPVNPWTGVDERNTFAEVLRGK